MLVFVRAHPDNVRDDSFYSLTVFLNILKSFNRMRLKIEPVGQMISCRAKRLP
jgi:hypothetical protein